MTPRYTPDPDRDLVLDASTMKALSHPLRVHLVGLLRVDGSATATQLAARAGVNSGATSYHLRQLAEAGLIVEDEGRGNAREKYWKAVHRSTYYASDDLLAEGGAAYLHSVIEVNAASMRRAIDELPAQSPEWGDSYTFSDVLLRVTPQEAADLLGEVQALVERYREGDAEQAPAGSRHYSFGWQGYLTPGASDVTDGPGEGGL